MSPVISSHVDHLHTLSLQILFSEDVGYTHPKTLLIAQHFYFNPVSDFLTACVRGSIGGD